MSRISYRPAMQAGRTGETGETGKLGNWGNWGTGELGKLGKLGKLGELGETGGTGELEKLGNWGTGELRKLGKLGVHCIVLVYVSFQKSSKEAVVKPFLCVCLLCVYECVCVNSKTVFIRSYGSARC